MFVSFDTLCPSQQYFRYVGMGLPWLNQYEAEDNVSCSRTQCNASISSQALYHWAPNFQNQSFWKILSAIPIPNSLGPDQTDTLSGMTWAETVCKGYQETALVGKELKQS